LHVADARQKRRRNEAYVKRLQALNDQPMPEKTGVADCPLAKRLAEIRLRTLSTADDGIEAVPQRSLLIERMLDSPHAVANTKESLTRPWFCQQTSHARRRSTFLTFLIKASRSVFPCFTAAAAPFCILDPDDG
jgi:hypothetical protein